MNLLAGKWPINFGRLFPVRYQDRRDESMLKNDFNIGYFIFRRMHPPSDISL